MRRCYALVLLVCAVAMPGMAISKNITLKRAMSLKTITVASIANGGINDKSLHLELANNTDTEYTVTIEPALIFVPEDTMYQNQVIQGDEVVVLPPRGRKSLDMSAFCGKSYARCPNRGLVYHFWRQGDSNMVKVLRYARKNTIPRDLMQRAVWTFTNNHALSTVYSEHDPVVSEGFVKYIASVRKCLLPTFYMNYKLDNRQGRPMVGGDPTVYLTLHWGHEGYRQMYLDIFKENGDLYRRVEADRIIDKDGYTVQLQLDPIHDPKGKYTVRLHDNANKVWDEQTVMVGIDPHDVPGHK